MRKLSSIIASLAIIGSSFVNAQVAPGSNCNQAGCSTSGSYTNLTGVSSMGTYSCLYSTPNPNWLAFSINSSGSIHLVLTQTSSSGNMIDVDFALYGPYTSVSAGCPIGPSTPTVDCSYSASATEYVDITNAVAGQVYILLVTNYNGSSGTISIQPSSSQPSSGSVSCNINFSATATQTPATCGMATGSVSVTPNGGFPPYTYSWNTPGNPTTQTVTNVPPGTYTVTVTSSPNPTNGQIVNPTTATVTVQNQNATYTATSTPSSCPNGADGTATANYSIPGGASAGVTATYLWSNGQTTQTATGLTPGPYSCQVTLSNGCTGTANATVGANNPVYGSSSTLVSCPGGSDGTASVSMTPVVGTLSYLWNDAAAQTTQTATGLTAGTYNCQITSSIGCSNTVAVTVLEIPGMQANFTTVQDASCNSLNDGVLEVSVNQGTMPYSYAWDNSTSTYSTANDLYAGTHTVTITDANSCVISMTETIGEPLPLQITSLTPDTQICPEDDITLAVTGTGGSTTKTYTWYEGTTVLGTGNSMTVDPDVTNTQYCVVLSEACGSPTTSACVNITFPTPIPPMLMPNQYSDCVPGEFEFANVSPNGQEIATTLIDFGDTKWAIEQGNDSTSHTYNFVGTYSLIVTNTSIYGCVYTDTLEDLITVLPNPVANFYFSDNPASVFETTIKAYEKGTPDVVQWDWTSPGSVPGTSGIQNPTFVFPEGVEGTYPVTLIVTSYHGCVDSVTLNLVIQDDILFYAPTAFTPDGDEFNQVWKISLKGTDIYGFNLKIFNRWGEIIWESNDPAIGWDGTYNGRVVQAGSYSWRASMKNKNDDGKHEYSGTVNVLK